MGVLNVTPDSFSDGGRFLDPKAAVARGRRLFEDGADLVDVGGESTRPGAEPVPADVELERIVPVVQELVESGVVSIDTSKSEVAAAAIAAGAEVVNDVTAAADASMVSLLVEQSPGVVLMHMQGDPPTMQDHPQYDDVVGEVGSYLRRRAAELEAAGMPGDRIVVDPGIGFGKTLEHNLDLLAGLDRLAERPVLVGVSRKGFIGKLTGRTEPADREEASAAAAVVAAALGASIVRVHNVAMTREMLGVADAIVRRMGRESG